MRMLIALAVTLLFAACGGTRNFDSMSAEERLAIGSDELMRACVAAGNPHERSFQEQREIARGRKYLAYVAAHVRSGGLDRYISSQALWACLDTEGWPRDVRRLILDVGSDEHVEMIVESANSPRFYCSQDLTRFFGSHDAERLIAACGRLDQREIAD